MKIEIPIFFAFNDDYSVPAAIAFHTLLYHAKPQIFYSLFVLHSDISKQNQELLLEIVNKHKNADINFINTRGFLTDKWEKGSFNKDSSVKFSSDALIRCFAARFFPQYDKIIYSDVDIVFMDDISELWEINLQDEYIAAIKHPFIKFDPKELSHLSKEHYEKLKDSYFAGGIWVLNLSALRRDNLEKTMMQIIEDDSFEKRGNDQDIMNIACEGRVKFISLRYISFPYLTDMMNKDGFESHYSKEELMESIYKPKILHYAAWKPWKNTETRKADIWFDVFYELKLPKTKIFKTFSFKDLPLKNKIRYRIWKYLGDILKSKGII
jgi:lipopolysaccharide biosynthesis glycosyltransferase